MERITLPPTLGADVDSTLWPFPEWMCASLTERLGYEVRPSDVDSWDYVYGLPEQEVVESFAETLDPARVASRPFYPGCVEVLRRLRRREVRLAVVTCNHAPETMREPLTRWLAAALGEPVAVEEPGMPISLQVLGVHESKLEALRKAGADALVDDKPATLVEAADAGLQVATLTHPYNRELVESRADIRGFESWEDFEVLEKMLLFEEWKIEEESA